MIRYALVLLALLSGTTLMHGCASAVVVAGGATAAVATTDRRTLGAFVDDESIEIKSRRAINNDDELWNKVHINVTSVNGVVLLTGEATNAEARDRAIALVREIPGIRRIVNEVRMAEPSTYPSRTQDAWITSKVKTRLLAREKIPSTQIKVVTENAVVYLMGLVKRQEADLAAETTRTVSGITRVVKLFEYLD